MLGGEQEQRTLLEEARVVAELDVADLVQGLQPRRQRVGETAQRLGTPTAGAQDQIAVTTGLPGDGLQLPHLLGVRGEQLHEGAPEDEP
ncbi:hypothetical protein ACN28I_07015 [Archangium gephyra]|uniref:hypothetical protein n=1 Tax=Archangium gephyra TaxID=48 RepID=UPI003B7C2F07